VWFNENNVKLDRKTRRVKRLTLVAGSAADEILLTALHKSLAERTVDAITISFEDGRETSWNAMEE